MTASNGIILYDFLAVRGGAEKLTLTLLESLPDTQLCFAWRCSTAFPECCLPKAGYFDLNVSSSNTEWRRLKTILAFERKTTFLRSYDWVLFSGVYAPMAVKNHLHGINLLYCHTIPRFAYDLKDYYLSIMPPLYRPIFILFALLMRYRYSKAVARMDVIIANSENVKHRLEKYLHRSAMVIYPPVETNLFSWIDQKDYYVSLARLEHFKRVDLIVKAFLQMPDKKLVVTSNGSDMERLQRLADDAPNILFTGWQTQAQLRQWIGSTIAAIYLPIDEDFGISPVEAMAAGKPVIGVAEGGLLETVVPDRTGILLNPPPTIDAIISAVHQMTPQNALEMRASCELQARRFDKEIFLSRMGKVIGMAMRQKGFTHGDGIKEAII